MKTLTLEQLLAATGGRLMGSAPLTAQVQQVSTDSRSIQPGSLFVPLVGEQFDGHNFIPMALQAGAAGFLTAREMPVPEGSFAILVPDTQLALEALAAWYRRQFRIPVVAVTGSVGKTTTKDMIAAVLGEKYTVLKTDGNFNNNVGMPLTILRLEDRHQIAVVEMGMDKPGEIACLTRIGRPDVAVITNIGDAHIERLGSREATLRAKLEIFEGMTEAGLAVLNGDDDALRTVEGRLAQQIVWYGCSEGCDWQAESIEEHWSDHLRCVLHSPDSSWSQMIPGLGAHMVYPALTAAIVGRRFGVSDEQICRGILDFEPTKMRMAIVHRGSGITILNDTYNANPQSGSCTARKRGAVSRSLRDRISGYRGRAGCLHCRRCGKPGHDKAFPLRRSGAGPGGTGGNRNGKFHHFVQSQPGDALRAAGGCFD